MIRRLLVLLAVSFAALAGAESRTVTVPTDYPTIKAAVDAAAPGDTVLIKPGQYQESLVLDKAVTIRGEAPEQVLIHNSVLAGTILTIKSKETVHLENLIVEHSDKEPDQENLKHPDLIRVEGGNAEVRQCVMRKGAGSGLIVWADGFALAENCRMEKNAQGGIAVAGKNAGGRFERNTASENAWGGISVFEEGTGEFIENTLVKNGRSGIFVFGPGPEGLVFRGNHVEESANTGIQIDQRKGVVLESNTVVKNAGGIKIETGAQVTAKDNTCEENNGAGILVSCVLTDAVLEGNKSSKNKGPGILVHAGAKARVAGNTVLENTANGMVVRNWDTTAEITGNTGRRNGAQGILVALGATASVDGNICTENGGRGIAATDEGTAATIGTNTLENNADQAPLKDMPLSRQGQVDKFGIGWALAAGQFDYLEQFAGRLRDGKCRDIQGAWDLNAFYEGLSEGYWYQSWKQKEPFMARVQEWCAQKPQSVTARILLAKTYVNYAWEARGGGYASETTPEGLKGFKDNLAEAEKVLKEAEALPEKDPALYETWIYTGMGLNYKREQQDALLEKSVALAPDFYAAYDRMAFNLTPRWHGSARELRDFFNHARDVSKNTCGDTLYTMLVAGYMGEYNCIYAGSGALARWDDLDGGFKQLLQDFPDSTSYLNHYCMVACVFQKRELAAELFAKIGDTGDPDVWGDDEDGEYRNYRRWATMENYPFPCKDNRSLPFNVTPEQVRRYALIAAAALIGLAVFTTIFIVVFFGGKAMRQPKK